MHEPTRTHAARTAGPRRRCPATAGGRLMTVAAVAVGVLVAGCSGTGPAPDEGPTTTAASAPGDPRTTPSASSQAPVPAPDEHSAVGALPDDFPSDLLPVPPGAEILVATYAPEADAGADQPYAVSLNVRTSLSVDEVVGLYRSSLTAAGFVESTGAPGGSLTAESTFSRSGGQEIVVVGVLDRDGSRTVTAGGRIRSAA